MKQKMSMFLHNSQGAMIPGQFLTIYTIKTSQRNADTVTQAQADAHMESL